MKFVNSVSSFINKFSQEDHGSPPLLIFSPTTIEKYCSYKINNLSENLRGGVSFDISFNKGLRRGKIEA